MFNFIIEALLMFFCTVCCMWVAKVYGGKFKNICSRLQFMTASDLGYNVNWLQFKVYWVLTGIYELASCFGIYFTLKAISKMFM